MIIQERVGQLFRIFGNIDDDVILEAKEAKKAPQTLGVHRSGRNKRMIYFTGVAASFAFLALIAWGVTGAFEPSVDQGPAEITLGESAPSSEREDTMEWTNDDSETDDMLLSSTPSRARPESEEEERALGSIPILPPEEGEMRAYTVDFHIESTDFMLGMRLLFDEVAELGGYSQTVFMNGTSLHRPHVERTADFTFRVPNENLSDFLVFIEDTYNIVRFDMWETDFTFVYDRNVDELESLREQQQQLMDELNNDEDSNTTQADLDAIRDQIRNLEEINTLIERDVNYSDITIRLSEVILPETGATTFGEWLHVVFSNEIVIVLSLGAMITVITMSIMHVVKSGRKKNVWTENLTDNQDVG